MLFFFVVVFFRSFSNDIYLYFLDVGFSSCSSSDHLLLFLLARRLFFSFFHAVTPTHHLYRSLCSVYPLTITSFSLSLASSFSTESQEAITFVTGIAVLKGSVYLRGLRQTFVHDIHVYVHQVRYGITVAPSGSPLVFFLTESLAFLFYFCSSAVSYIHHSVFFQDRVHIRHSPGITYLTGKAI